MATNQSDILERIHALLDRQEWDADTCVAIAEAMRAGGYEIREPDDGSQHDAECEDCGWQGSRSALKPIRDLHERVAPGEAMPAGECPQCGALAHLTEDADE
jgi:hypothetical protein